MPDLPDVNQTFDANAAPFLAAVDSMIAALDRLAAMTGDVRTAMVEMAAVAEASAGVIDAAMSSAARATDEVGSAARDAAGSTAELAAILRMMTFATDSAEASEMHLSEITQTLGIIQKNTADSALSLMLVEQLLGQILEKTGAAARGAAGDLLLLGAAGKTAAAGQDAVGASAVRTIGWFRLTANAIHWIVMGTLEIAATAIPALFALTAAGAAMAPTFAHIADQMNYLRTATGSWSGVMAASVGPLQAMGAAGVRLRQAVAPDAYIIFGAAINSLVGHVGAFSGVAQQASNVLAQFASKLSAELAGPLGGQLAGFFANAVKYMIQWGQLLGNFGHAFINIVGGMHGVGQILLDVLLGISHALVLVTSNTVVSYLIGVAAAMSAVYRYGKLMQAAFNWLGGGALFGGIKTAISGVQTLYGVFQKAGKGMTGLAAAGTGLVDLLGPLGMAALALSPIFIALALSGKNAADATDNLISHYNKLPPTMQNLNNGMTAMGANLVHLTQSYGRLNTSQLQTASVQTRLDGTYRQSSAATQQYNRDVTNTINEIKSLVNQTINLQTGMAQAGMRTGQVGAAMNVMAIQTAIADSKVQSMNQAIDQYIGLLTGGTSAMANFVIGMSNIGTVTATTGINNLSQSTTQLTLNTKEFVKALGQITTVKGASAWQNLNQVINSSMAPMADWLRQLQTVGAVSGPQFSKAMLDMAASVIPYVKGNTTAQHSLLGFMAAQGLVYPTFGKLVTAAGSQSTAMKNLAGIVDTASNAFSNLSQMAKNAANAMSAQVASGVAKAALASTNYNADLLKLQHDMANHAPASVIERDSQNIANDVQTAGQRAVTAGNQIYAGLTHAGTGATIATGKVLNLQKVVDGLHGKTITISVVTAYSTRGSPSAYIPGSGQQMRVHPASGGEIHGPGTSRSDSIPAMLSDGEFVMRASAVKHYGLGLMHAINAQRLAGGGPVLVSSPTGGGAGNSGGGTMVHVSNITLMMDSKAIGTALRTEYLTYGRRNTSSNLTLRIR